MACTEYRGRSSEDTEEPLWTASFERTSTWTPDAFRIWGSGTVLGGHGAGDLSRKYRVHPVDFPAADNTQYRTVH